MSSKKIKIDKIAHLNLETYSRDDMPDVVEYLDTGSLTKNKIENLQKYSMDLGDLPSRAQRKAKKNTILYSTVRPNLEHHGILENPPQNIIVSTGFTTIDVHDEAVDPKYLYYAITQKYYTKYLHTIATNNVSSYPSINPDDLGNLVLSIPEKIEDQKRIAAVLSALDAKIELNNRINAELEAMTKTLYDYWFVQFDFICSRETAIAQGKPELEGKPYKSSGGKMVYSTDLKREIPEGWVVGTLENCIVCIIDHRGKTPLKMGGDWSSKKDDIIALSGKIVKGGKLVNLDQANRVTREMYNKWMPVKLQSSDILMTSEAPLGEFYYLLGKSDYCLSQRLFAIRANNTTVLAPYLYYELSKGNGYSQIIGSQSGSTVFGIRQDELRKINVLIPKLEIQQQFDKNITPMLSMIKNNDTQNQQLSSLRDFLLPMLMNGQVNV